MTYGQPGEPWQQHPDDDAWRDYDASKHRRLGFRLTVKQALIGLVVLVVVMIVAAELIGASGSPGPNSSTVSPAGVYGGIQAPASAFTMVQLTALARGS